MRETREEAQAEIVELQLFGVFNIPHISQVYVMFVGQMLNAHRAPTHESLETSLYDEHSIPWDELAFPVVRESLELYFSDRKNNYFSIHFGDIIRDENEQLLITRY